MVGNAGREARVGTSSDSPDRAEGDARIGQEEDMAHYQVDVVHCEVEWLAAHEVALDDGRSSHLRKPRRLPSTRQAAATAGVWL